MNRKIAIRLSVLAIAIVLLMMVVDFVRADDRLDTWIEANAYRMKAKQPQQLSIRERAKAMDAARPLYPNGTPWSDEALAESNKTRYNASGKQMVSRRVESWRSPLWNYDNEPGVYSTGYLGRVPSGPTGGPYCPPGYNCFRIEREGRGYEQPSYYRRFRP